MGKLLNETDRARLEKIMSDYFVVDAIRSEFGDPMNAREHLSEIHSTLAAESTAAKNRVHQMSDEELLDALTHARTSTSKE